MKLDTLRVEYAKHKAPLKAKTKAIKLELAVLATADSPDDKAIDAQINALMDLKREMKQHKYRYISAKRKVLTAEQQTSFDMDVLKRAKKKGRKGY